MPDKKRGFHALEERIHKLEEEHEQEQEQPRQASKEQPAKEKQGSEKPLKS